MSSVLDPKDTISKGFEHLILNVPLEGRDLKNRPQFLADDFFFLKIMSGSGSHGMYYRIFKKNLW